MTRIGWITQLLVCHTDKPNRIQFHQGLHYDFHPLSPSKVSAMNNVCEFLGDPTRTLALVNGTKPVSLMRSRK